MKGRLHTNPNSSTMRSSSLYSPRGRVSHTFSKPCSFVCVVGSRSWTFVFCLRLLDCCSTLLVGRALVFLLSPVVLHSFVFVPLSVGTLWTIISPAYYVANLEPGAGYCFYDFSPCFSHCFTCVMLVRLVVVFFVVRLGRRKRLLCCLLSDYKLYYSSNRIFPQRDDYAMTSDHMGCLYSWWMRITQHR